MLKRRVVRAVAVTVALTLKVGVGVARGDTTPPSRAPNPDGPRTICEAAFARARSELLGTVPSLEHAHVYLEHPVTAGVAWRVTLGLSSVGLVYDVHFTELTTSSEPPGSWQDQRLPTVLRTMRRYSTGWAQIQVDPPSAAWGPEFLAAFKRAADRCAGAAASGGARE